MIRRRGRAVVSAASVALASTAAGIAVNLATDRGGSVLAWVLVAVCTVVLVVVTGVVEALAERPADSPGIKLVIEADGRRIIAYTDEAVRELGRLAVPLAASGPARAPEQQAVAEGTETATTGAVSQDVTSSVLSQDALAGAVSPDAVGALSQDAKASAVSRGATVEGADAEVEVPAVVRVALVTRRKAPGITRRLERVHAVSGAPALDVRLHVDDDPRRRLAGLLAAHVAVLDDHCSAFDGNPAPLVGGLDLAALRDSFGRGPAAFLVVLACRDGFDDAHAKALASSLDGPAVLLAARGAAPLEHRAVLLPPVLGAVGDLAGRRVTAAELGKAVDGVLGGVRAQRPQMDWGRWGVRVLRPRP